MKAESDPVAPDEVVLRMIWRDLFDAGVVPPIMPRAFRPRDNEGDGISVFRSACLAAPTDALAVLAPDKRSLYAIAAVPVAELTALGLTVQPARIDTVPGHAVIPELNAVG